MNDDTLIYGGPGVKGATDETVCYPGGEIKALGDGWVGGLAVPFGSPATADPQGDFFTPSTDLGLDITNRVRTVFHHGLTAKHRSRRFGIAEMEIKADGVHARTRLDLSDPDAAHLYSEAEAGRLFHSSGSVDRLVTRRPVDGKSEILTWPLIEISLTPTPVDRRNRVLAIKALIDGEAKAADDPDPDPDAMAEADESGACPTCNGPAASMACAAGHQYKPRTPAAKAALDTETPDEGGAVAAPSLVERTEALVAEAEVIRGLYADAIKSRAAEGRPLSEPKRAAIREVVERFRALDSQCDAARSADELETLRRQALVVFAQI
jgi:hypothetical protein